MIEEINKTYDQIENKILNHEIYQKVKDYSKAKEKMKTYLEVGKLLKDADIKYGNNVIKEVSNKDTIGILICKRENKFVIEYCSDDRIAVR